MSRYFFRFILFFFIALLLFKPVFGVNTDITVEVTGIKQCNDSADNDSDGLTDYPNDPGCSSSNDDDETDVLYCGDGTCNNGENCSTCSADCGACPPSGGGGGGGGGAPPVPVTATISFSGRAYPKSTVTLLKDAQVAITTVAGADAIFQMSLASLTPGSYVFSIFTEDVQKNRSNTLSFPISLISGASTYISGIYVAPTISLDKSEVARGDDVAIFGQSTPVSNITIMVNSEEPTFATTKTDASGIYLYNLDTTPLEIGQHYAKSKAAVAGEVSSFSKSVGFSVGTKTVPKDNSGAGDKGLRADINKDGRVNLIDFSIAAYWYKKSNPPAHVDQNDDQKVNLVDFSIIVYYWTG